MNVPLRKNVQSLDVSPQFKPYSGVEITVSEDSTIVWPTDDTVRNSGRVLKIENPMGTLTQAQKILAALQSNGFQYQPYMASGALLNPAAELGDAVTINGTYSGIYKMTRNYSSMMSAEIEAPQDEEIDHEYPYEPKQDRIYKRELAEASAQISVTQNQIASEVTRATAAEGTLSSRITQNANNISAKVSQTGGNNSSFGWSLTSSKFSLYSGNTEVFKCTSSGVEIQGKITATSGYIGNGSNGFTITSTSMYNGMNSINSSSNGVFIGTNGIALGGGKFKVTSSGAVTASNLSITGGSIAIGNNFRVTSAGNITANNAVLTGTLTVGGSTITADQLRSGAQTAYNRSSTWNGTTTTVNNKSSSWTTGANYGYNYNAATQSGTSSYPSYFTVTNLTVKNRASVAYLTASSSFGCPSSFQVGGIDASWKQVTINGTTIKYLGRS